MSVSKPLKLVVFGRFQALLFMLVGFVLGAIYSVGGLIYDLTSTGINTGTFLAFMALIGMPLIGWLTGFFLGLVEAVLYNMYLSLFNGFDIEIN